jgi:subtilase family serine protease
VAQSDNPLTVRSTNRVREYIDDERRLTLRGNRHPLARAEFDVGAAADDLRMERMILGLRPSDEQQKALAALIEAQHDPNSPLYQRWLSPQEYGDRFGVSENDIALISDWLTMQGMEIEEVSTGRTAIIFNGTAAQVQRAFRTQVRRFKVGGELHYANSDDPEIPLALAKVVSGVISLHNFRATPMHVAMTNPQAWPTVSAPQYSAGSSHYVTPTDLATIYNVAPLYSRGFDGTGQSIAVVARSNINLADVRQFRSTFGLPANDPQVIVTGADPGTADRNELVESMLDAEWAGGMAMNATTKVVVSASTSSSDGVFLSAQYIVNHNVAPVMTMSFGLCESLLGSSANSFLNSLWQQAAAQGISVFVSSGDSGAAGCDYSSATTATRGLGINGLCSSPYSTCVGGTQFDDTTNASTYWASGNTSGTLASALSYIPEKAWNESGTSGLWSTGGGASIVYQKPTWQTVPGVPADGMRDVPDVSLTAAGHDGYLVYVGGGLTVVGGTSASSPALAGIMTLVNQSAGRAQGLANPTFYALARKQQSGGAAVFHDVTSGTNSVPGATGYSAVAGYDLATGLGSIDASQLVANWNNTTSTPSPAFQLATTTSAVTVASGGTGTVTASVTVSGGFSSTVALGVTGLPVGLTASLTPTSFAAPGSGSSAVKFTAASTLKAGSYTVSVTATSGGVSKSASVVLTVAAPPSFAMSAGATSLEVVAGSTGSISVTTAGSGGWNSAAALSVTGLPSGVTAAFAPATIAAPGSGTSTLTLSASSAAKPGNYVITIGATSAGVVKTTTVTVVVTPPASFSIAASTTLLTATVNTTQSVSVKSTITGRWNSAVALTVSGMPSGMSAVFSPATIAGSGVSTLRITAGSNVVPGKYSLSIAGTSAGQVVSVALSVNVPGFWLSGNLSTLSMKRGTVATVSLTTAAFGGLNSSITFSATGLPSGVTVGFSPASVAAPGSGSVVATVTASTSALVGTTSITLTATAAGISKSWPVTLTVTAPATFTLSAVPVSPNGSSSLALQLSTTPLYGFSAPISFSASGVPTGVIATFSALSVAGGGKSTFTMSANSIIPKGTYTIKLTATGGGTTQQVILTLTVGPAPSVTGTNAIVASPNAITTSIVQEKSQDDEQQADGPPGKLKPMKVNER